MQTWGVLARRKPVGSIAWVKLGKGGIYHTFGGSVNLLSPFKEESRHPQGQWRQDSMR